MKKILHIGGSHSVHVAHIVHELYKQGYQQCVLSYKKQNIIKNNIPVYYFPYNKFYPDRRYPKDNAALKKLIHKIIIKENPDILHGHFLIFSCVALSITKGITNMPTVLSPWSMRVLNKNAILKKRLEKCFVNTNAILTDKRSFFNMIKARFPKHVKNSMFYQFRLPLDLSPHHAITAQQKNTAAPRILSARMMGKTYHQDLLVRSLPKIFDKYKDATATFIIGHNASQGKTYFLKIKELAKNLGIANRCTFIPEVLPPDAFSKLLLDHNIVYSVCEDPGCAQTTIQACYAGNVTIVRNNPLENGILDNNKNVLKVDLTVPSVTTVLDTACENLSTLLPQFFENNRKFKEHSTEYTLPVLLDLYKTI